MATAASVATDITTCPICLELFNNPKSLPCLHAFCLRCLQEHFRDNHPMDEVQCPMCRKEFRIPAGGLHCLQHHFIIQQLVDIRKASDEDCDGVPCKVCLLEGEEGSVRIASATTYCFDCSQKLCDPCSKPHKWMKGGAHRVERLGVEVEKELSQLQASSCDKHTDEQVKLYCSDCNENICLLCSTDKHRNHKSNEIPDVAQSFRLRIDDDNKRIFSAVHGLREQLEGTKQDAADFLIESENVKTAVIATGDIIKRSVDNKVNDILMELDSVTSESAGQATTVQETLQLALLTMESFHAYSQELLDTGRPSDITRAASELHDRATELLNSDVAKYRPPHMTFKPADVTQVKRLNFVGQFFTTRTEKQPDNAGTLHTPYSYYDYFKWNTW